MNTVLLAGLVLLAVGFTVWPGCAIVPLPSKRVPVDARDSAQFKRTKHLTREQVTAQLGPPDEYVADIRVACYRVNDVTRRKVFLCLFVIPIDVQKYPAHDLALIEFDEMDRVRRAEIVTRPSHIGFATAARRWISSSSN